MCKCSRNTERQYLQFENYSVVIVRNDVNLSGLHIEKYKIGTTTPNSKLDVYGTVTFEGASHLVTASIGGGALLAGACASTNTTISAPVASTTAFETTPQSDPGDGFFWNTILLSSTTAKTRVCASVAGTPNSSIYNVKIIK